MSMKSSQSLLNSNIDIHFSYNVLFNKMPFSGVTSLTCNKYDNYFEPKEEEVIDKDTNVDETDTPC